MSIYGYPSEGSVRFNVSVEFDYEAMTRVLNDAQIEAVMNGIAQIMKVDARPAVTEPQETA